MIVTFLLCVEEMRTADDFECSCNSPAQLLMSCNNYFDMKATGECMDLLFVGV